MAQKVASLYAEIGADTSNLERGIDSVKKNLKDTGGDFTKFSQQFTSNFLGGLQKGSASMDDFGLSLINAADKAGLGTTEIAKMTSATGIFSEKQILAARSSADVARKAAELSDAVRKGEMTTRQAGKAFAEYAKSQEVAADSSEALLGNLLKYGAIIGGGAIAVAKISKELYNLGKAGAAVEQTGESFDFLSKKLGLSETLLEDLREASNYTIDDMTLMSATATLLAGTSDELGKAMGDSAKDLMEIAKAANKLNPSLGTTSYMYESIALGIKRSSPLILDNLGLTIKIGEANSKFAKSIGKSVEELTAEEQKIALLNATLDAGDTLISQVGGSTESASDAFAQLETAATNLKDELAMALAPAISKTATGLAKLLQESRKARDVQADLRNAYDRGIITLGEMNDVLDEHMSGLMSNAQVYDWLNPQVEKFEYWINRSSEAVGEDAWMLVYLADKSREASKATDELTDEEKEAIKVAEKLEEQRRAVNLEMHKTIGLADESKSAISKMLDVADRKITSPIANLIEDMKWIRAGGGYIQQELAAVNQALERGEITPDQAVRYWEQLFLKATDLQLELDQIDATEAATNVSETLGVSFAEAKQILEDINRTDIDIMGELTIAVKLAGDKLALSILESNFGAGGIQGYLDLPEYHLRLGSRTGGKKPRRQYGGMVAGAGAYLVGERGPELFVPGTGGRIIPNQELNYGGDTIIINNYTSNAATLSNAMVEERRRARLNASMNR